MPVTRDLAYTSEATIDNEMAESEVVKINVNTGEPQETANQTQVYKEEQPTKKRQEAAMRTI